MAETEKKTAAKTTAAKTKAKAAAEAAAAKEAEEAASETAETATEETEAETEADETETEAEEMDEAVLIEGEYEGEALEAIPLEELLADAIPEYDEDTPTETLLAIAAQVGLDGLEDKVKAYLIKVLDDFFDGMTEAEDYPEVEDFQQTETAYGDAKEDIRRIAQGANDDHQPKTWREAVLYWERKHPNKKNAKHRAAFFVDLGIATTSECALLDGDGDIS